MLTAKLRSFACVLVAGLALTAPARAQDGFAAGPWLQDLDQLRDAMTAGYANLEWQTKRGLDLPRIYARTRARIETARDPYEARRTFELFLTAFGDGHLEIHWPAAGPTHPSGPEDASPLCARLGYFDLHDGGGAALRLPGAKAVGAPNAHLKAAVVETAGRRVAVLRVGMFSPHGYPDICDEAARRLGLSMASPCDQPCQDSFDQTADALFVGEMARQVQALAAVHPDVLLVDIGGNGGGDDSSLALARMVTGKPLQRPRGGGVRGAGWAAEFASREADVARALAKPAGGDRTALLRFDAALVNARAEALKTCDRGPLWLGRPIGCTALTPEPLFNGFWSYIPKPDDPVANARTVWTGPLLVLVDGDSASSAEWFAAMLQDSKAATILGSPTFGAGCGHVTDTPPVKLAHSGGTVSMPDCYRLRANGDNEVDGVEPDVLIGFREHDALPQRAARLSRALPQALARLGKP